MKEGTVPNADLNEMIHEIKRTGNHPGMTNVQLFETYHQQKATSLSLRTTRDVLVAIIIAGICKHDLEAVHLHTEATQYPLGS